jgi:methanogenic corrinoid protein MtbC1
MTTAELFKQYLQHLFRGRRAEAREVLIAAQDRGVPASKLLKGIIWPAMEQIDQLYREDKISRIVEHMATRINRSLADQLQVFLRREPKDGRRLVVTCGNGEIEELGAQIVADLFEARGWSVWFLGSGVPNDEVLHFVGQNRPDVLCIYGAEACGVPNIRQLIGLIREVNACDHLQVLCVGGVFNRADGLADEIRADLFAEDVEGALKTVEEHPVRVPKPDVPQPGRRRKRKNRTAKPTAKMRQAAGDAVKG